MQKHIVPLFNAPQARQALQRAWDYAKPRLISGERLILEVRPQNRSDAQNRVLHARIADCARQIEWPKGSGQHQDVDAFKRLLVAAYLRAKGDDPVELPALDGRGVDIVFKHTSKMTRSECAELSDWILAWGDAQGVQWSSSSLCGLECEQ